MVYSWYLTPCISPSSTVGLLLYTVFEEFADHSVIVRQLLLARHFIEHLLVNAGGLVGVFILEESFRFGTRRHAHGVFQGIHRFPKVLWRLNRGGLNRAFLQRFMRVLPLAALHRQFILFLLLYRIVFLHVERRGFEAGLLRGCSHGVWAYVSDDLLQFFRPCPQLMHQCTKFLLLRLYVGLYLCEFMCGCLYLLDGLFLSGFGHCQKTAFDG